MHKRVTQKTSELKMSNETKAHISASLYNVGFMFCTGAIVQTLKGAIGEDILRKEDLEQTIAQQVAFLLFDDFKTNDTNPEFQDNIIYFHIICHYDQWQLKDFKLRPFRIAAELKTMLEQVRLTGIGELEFIGMSQLNYTDEFMGVGMMFYAIHGGEDKKFMPNPEDDEQFVKEFKEMMRNG